ncbi:MAG: malto-oligosyltrehalose trehalohydrolase [Deltaproteobacteria bacterium]|nr:malto-oligosyltrehalose trehalohydrolase [Deltaproteobacteria bacterium]
MQLGAFADDHGTTFRLWTDQHADCAVRLYGADLTIAMAPRGEGLFEVRVAGIGHGERYRFVVDGEELSDPYGRALPEGVGGPAMVYRSSYRWRHDHVTRPLADHILYELHVGTFTREGTYAAAADRLGHLVELGITTIELLPVAAFGGHHGWGYDGVAHYAPHPAYGTPDELRAFVDAAHGVGLSVLMDVVYNHFGPAGNVLGKYSPRYFTKVPNVWGEAPDFTNPWMRRYVIDNVKTWIAEFRCDGLRFDAVHAIADAGVVRECIAAAREALPEALLIAEDDRNDGALVDELGFDAVWADDFHHAVHVTLTNERDGYYAAYEPGVEGIAKTIERGWLYEGQIYPTTERPRGRPAPQLPAEAFVYCIQNHDQVGNRALGERLTRLTSPEAGRTAALLMLFLPMTPMLFQGQEWSASTPFLYFTDHEPALGQLISRGRREEFSRFIAFSNPESIPDPQARETFVRSQLDWEERLKPPHADTLAMMRAAIGLRRRDPVLSRAGRDALSAEAHGSVLVVRRWVGGSSRILVANFGEQASEAPLRGSQLVASSKFELPMLPPWSAAIVASERAG